MKTYVYTKNMYMPVHSHVIQSSPKVERAQMSIIWWMDKLNVVHSQHWMLTGYRKEWNADTCHDVLIQNRDKSQKYYAKWKKRVTEGHLVYDSIYKECPE